MVRAKNHAVFFFVILKYVHFDIKSKKQINVL